MSRILVVSNRLPVTSRIDGDEIRFAWTSGGLATGLRSWHERAEAVWIGWPGDVGRYSDAQRDALDRKLRDRGISPVYLSQEEVERYYEGFANRVIWPLFHYLVDRVPVDASGWEVYREANEKFAQVVADAYRPGDLVWVHDYQLMLVPALLRERLPDARIGFFLHIPFPSSEVFRILPWRSQVLHGLLGADLIGFHTFAYLRHFVTSLLHIEGIESEVDRIRVDDRSVAVGVFPMSIDALAFADLARDADVIAGAEAIRRDAGERRILLGVDRLDYTKGIPRRLQAFERLFEQDPEMRDQIRYIQIAVPSREKVDSYQSFRRLVEEAVGRINGAHATLRSTPIHYMHRSISRRQLVSLYAAADVMLVTPLRDGMNLVAKEFIASRVDEDGVLILSEFAGAAAELGEAVVVNPYDVDSLAAAIRRSLAMDPAERRARMRNLRRRVMAQDVHRWAERFVEQLGAALGQERTRTGPRAGGASLAAAVDRLRAAPHIALLLDYDGTLVPLAPAPELAVPDADLLALLSALAGRPATEVHIVSGRLHETLDAWFGHLRVALWAEHGYWRRTMPGGRWTSVTNVPSNWLDRIEPILQQFAASTPGSLVERKSAAAAWHYRIADPEFGPRQAHELRMMLGDALSNQPLEVLEGKKVVEIRVRGISKALVAQHVLASAPGPPLILAIGDDRSDEDLFAVLPESAITVTVGPGGSRAQHWLPDYHAVRELLRAIAETR